MNFKNKTHRLVDEKEIPQSKQEEFYRLIKEQDEQRQRKPKSKVAQALWRVGLSLLLHKILDLIE